MSEELKPCPFCGGHASITRKDVEPQGDPYYGAKVEDFVQCNDCGCVLFDQYFHDGFSSDEDAIKAWNIRTVQAAPSDRERRLETALLAYERFEANLLMDDESWRNSHPFSTDELQAEFEQCQRLRVAALAATNNTGG